MGCMQSLGQKSTRPCYPRFSRANRPSSVRMIGAKKHITVALAYVSSGFHLIETAKKVGYKHTTVSSIVQRPEIKRYIQEVVKKMEDKSLISLSYIVEMHKKCIEEGFVRDKSSKIDGSTIQSALKELTLIGDLYPKKDIKNEDQEHLQDLIAQVRETIKKDH